MWVGKMIYTDCVSFNNSMLYYTYKIIVLKCISGLNIVMIDNT